MPFDLYVWSAPRDLDAAAAEALVARWEGDGANPSTAPFEPSSDVGWFHRELARDEPSLELLSDAIPNPSRRPIVLSTEPEPPARLVAIRVTPTADPDALDTVFSLAAKYDLVLFDLRHGRVHLPLEAMAAYASATFWPRGAIQAAVAGVGGGLVAVIAWLLGIPILSGVVALAGGFMVVMAVLTFVHEGRKALARRRAT